MTTNIWNVSHTLDKYESYRPEGPVWLERRFYEEDYDREEYLRNLPVKTTKESLRLTRIKNRFRKKADFRLAYNSTLLCKAEVTAMFGPMITDNCETLRIPVDGEILDLHLVRSQVDAWDEERSDFERNEDGEPYYFRRIRLRPNVITEVDLFRLSTPREINIHLFCSDRFRACYEANGLTGLDFTKMT